MPITEQTPVNSYTGNGAVVTFPYTFKIFAAADLAVTVDGVTKALTTDYTVTGAGNVGGGNVVFVAAPDNAGHNPLVIIRRALTYDRSTDYAENGDFLAETVDGDFDRLVMLVQQLRLLMLQAVKVPVGETDDKVLAEKAADRAGRVLYFDANGFPTVRLVTELGAVVTINETGLTLTGGELSAKVVPADIEALQARVTEIELRTIGGIQ